MGSLAFRLDRKSISKPLCSAAPRRLAPRLGPCGLDGSSTWPPAPVRLLPNHAGAPIIGLGPRSHGHAPHMRLSIELVAPAARWWPKALWGPIQVSAAWHARHSATLCDARCSDPSPHTQSPPYYREGSQATMSKKLVIRVQYCGGCVDVVFKGRGIQNIQMGPTT